LTFEIRSWIATTVV